MAKIPTLQFNFTPFPSFIWEEGISMTQGEFQLLGYLLYTSIRLGRPAQIRLTDKEVMTGRRRADGGLYDRGSGIRDRNALKRARQKLIDRGWLKFDEDAADRGRPKRTYELTFIRHEDSDWFDAQSGGEKHDGVCEKHDSVCDPHTRSLREMSSSKCLPKMSSKEEDGIFTKAMQIWDSMASRAGLPQIRRMTEKRKTHLRRRLEEFGGLEAWQEACRRVSESPFLTGQNERNWRATFDFVITESKFTNIMEGGYNPGSPSITSDASKQWDRIKDQVGEGEDGSEGV